MNLDGIFQLEEDALLVSVSPLVLALCVLAAVGAGWFCARKYRDTCDIEKSIRLYIPIAVAAAIIFTLIGLPLLFSIGAQLCGFVAMLLISNHYF